MAHIQTLYLPGSLFLITVAFGFSVKSSGKPYNSLLFNIHKLAALAGVVVTVIRISPIFSGGNFTGWIWVVLVAAGLSVILLFATGALMSIREEEPGIARFLHQAGPMVLILCLAGMYFRY